MGPAFAPRTVAVAALQAALSGVWIAAAELTPVRRRLVRAGSVAALGAITLAVSPKSDETDSKAIVVGAHPRLVTEGIPPSEPNPAEFTIDKRKAAVTAGALGLALATNVGRRRLQKRWLARLTSDGHPHPTRVLAVRMAAVEFALQVAVQAASSRGAASRR